MAEAVTVSSRVLLIVITVAELLLACLVAQRLIVAVRSYRADRAAGLDGWGAAEDGLARVLPRKVARLLLVEPRLFAALIRWAARRPEATGDDTFSYHRGIRPMLLVFIALLVVEGVVADLLVAVSLPTSPWVWLVLTLHLYALVWFVSFYASMVVRPHEARADALHVRDGIFTELVIPWPAIEAVRVVRRQSFGRSGFKVCLGDGTALLAMGDATVCIDLDRQQPVGSPDGPVALSSLAITVDDVLDFQQKVGRQVTRATDAEATRRHTAGDFR